jgi:hypothetical protein
VPIDKRTFSLICQRDWSDGLAIAKQPNVLVTGSYSWTIAAVEDPIMASVEAVDGNLLSERIADDFELEDSTKVGSCIPYVIKNEHLVASPDAGADLITVASMETYEGIGNPDFTIGQEVAVVGYRSAPISKVSLSLNHTTGGTIVTTRATCHLRSRPPTTLRSRVLPVSLKIRTKTKPQDPRALGIPTLAS